MPLIKASVGIHSGKQCYNVVADQQVVIGLLNRVSMSKGGTREQPLDASPRWGMCSPALQKAILRFQAIYSLSQDGHVDPGGQTIRRMNQAAGDVLPQAAGDVLPGDSGVATGKKATGVGGFEPEPWYVSNLGLSGVSVIDTFGASGYKGHISMVNDDIGEFTYPIIGGGLGAGVSDGVPTSWLGAVLNKVTSAVSGSIESWKSDTEGRCFPMKGGLNRTSFIGSCAGVFLGEGVTVFGGSQWALFFGMPGADQDLIPLIHHAQGVAFLETLGLSPNLSVGLAINQFVGRIG